jgi:hypothetical protein
MDLAHILIRLVGASVEYLLQNQGSDPKISMKILENRGNHVLLSLAEMDGRTGERATGAASGGGLGARSDGPARFTLRPAIRLIEKYRGSLTAAEPTEGAGTVFHLWLPAVPAVTSGDKRD